MNIDDYLLSSVGWQWSELLQHWTWLLPPRFQVWMVNRFGDLVIRLDDGTVHHLDVGAGTLRRVASSRDEFCEICEDTDEANFFLMIPLVDQLVSTGCTLGPGKCYSYCIAPAFEGTFTLENIVVRPIAEHYNIFGPQHLLTRHIPDGTPFEFVIGTE